MNRLKVVKQKFIVTNKKTFDLLEPTNTVRWERLSWSFIIKMDLW